MSDEVIIDVNKGDVMFISLKKIDMDPSGIQPRDTLDGDLVKRYAELMDQGTVFPPVELWDIEETPGAKFKVADGYHRIAAARSIKRPTISARICVGSMLQCVASAISANSIHGKSLTPAERYSAILSYLAMVAEAKKPMPSIAFIVNMADVTQTVARRALREFKGSPAAEEPFENRAPVELLSERLCNTGGVSTDDAQDAEKTQDEAQECGFSPATAAAEKLIHDGKVAGANLRNAITAMVKAYEACEKLPTGVYFTKQRKSFDQYAGVIRKLESGCRPEQVCVCEGHGCNTCGGYGWINGHQAGSTSS